MHDPAACLFLCLAAALCLAFCIHHQRRRRVRSLLPVYGKAVQKAVQQAGCALHRIALWDCLCLGCDLRAFPAVMTMAPCACRKWQPHSLGRRWQCAGELVRALV